MLLPCSNCFSPITYAAATHKPGQCRQYIYSAKIQTEIKRQIKWQIGIQIDRLHRNGKRAGPHGSVYDSILHKRWNSILRSFYKKRSATYRVQMRYSQHSLRYSYIFKFYTFSTVSSSFLFGLKHLISFSIFCKYVGHKLSKSFWSFCK